MMRSETKFEIQNTASRLDIAFAEFLCQRSTLDEINRQQLKTILINLSEQQNQGHSCVIVNDSEKKLLLASELTSNHPTEDIQSYPLVIEDHRLYLHRYWHYENRLAKKIQQLSSKNNFIEDIDTRLNPYFPASHKEADSQREAAKKALLHSFCIITGGPGTGKTTTVCKILALLQELAHEPLTIALSAPTGKAAMRLQEAISNSLLSFDCAENIKTKLPQTAFTLHRLLGAKPPTPYFKHDTENPLTYDVIVVDEASMVDLALMSKLIDALKPDARLILLGDKDQLTSVESGSVLADLITALPENTAELNHSFRFDSTIKALAEAVNQQNGELAWEILSTETGNVGIINLQNLIGHILNKRQKYDNLVKIGANFIDIYKEFSRFQVLCANRHGNVGALAISNLIERNLFHGSGCYNGNSWYPGRPVLILQNNHLLGLYNGDIGICLPSRELEDKLMVYFQRPDGGVKQYPPAKIPSCETVFAMTVHKSQGSEYDEVLIVLPETINPVLCKELLYTAITRGKIMVNICAAKDVFFLTVNKKINRESGLTNKIKEKS